MKLKKVLIINAHQKYDGASEGRMNQTFFDAAIETLELQGCEVRTTYIEKGYDKEEEISKHEWADLVITQAPVFWFNSPWIHKKYIEEVFTMAISQGRLVADDGGTYSDVSKQYGIGGLSKGKKYLLSTTWNAPIEAFNDKKRKLFQGKTTDEVLINLPIHYKFCGYEIMRGFHSYNVIKDPQVETDLDNYKNYLIKIIQG